MAKADRYIPALSFGWLTPLYDPLLKWGIRDEHFKLMCEIYRVLHPDGKLHIVGFGKPHRAYAWLISHVMRRLEQAADNFQGLLYWARK